MLVGAPVAVRNRTLPPMLLCPLLFRSLLTCGCFRASALARLSVRTFRWGRASATALVDPLALSLLCGGRCRRVPRYDAAPCAGPRPEPVAVLRGGIAVRPVPNLIAMREKRCVMDRIYRFLFPTKHYDASASWLLLAARVVFGLMLLSHGIDKWRHFGDLAAGFPDPIGLGGRVALVLAIFAEVVCSAGIIVGAFFRLTLIPPIVMLCVALLVVHGGDAFTAKELAAAYLAVFVLLFLAGPGRFALDRPIAERLRRR